MNSVSPVWTDKEIECEHVIALDQHQYIPLIILPITYDCGHKGAAVRFRFSEEERKAIADGADLIVTELIHSYFTPIHVDLLMPNTRPEES